MANADRLIELFNEAKARPAGPERERFLAEACPGDPELKEQVITLLQAHAGAGDFLKNTLVLSPTALVTEKPGDKIGHYKLLQVIGEGGCGVVYMAEQEESVRRKVALKVIKLGMDTKQVVARFEAERQALALMDHPNIAKVFDAGATDTGRPFFVMELVRGIKITDYCDQHQLSTSERLDLFIQVCQAIQHAHQKGIIHRDIKPSNVLVTQHDTVAVPKVIDFGIAKATSDQRLTDKTLFTAFEQFMGTPAYMSPEQAQLSGLDIDTRTDIYSLGVLLYELLTGETPFDPEEMMRSGLDAMRRTIRDKEPARPSTRLSTQLVAADVRRRTSKSEIENPKSEMDGDSSRRLLQLKERIALVRGDLDWIVMKCLEKERTRRYETASGLAADLKCHLGNEPVMARPPSTAYRFQKAFRRHKLAFTAAAAVGIVLIVGVMVSTWQAIEASRARNAEKEQRLAVQTQRDKAQTAQKEAEQQTQRAQAALTRVEIERAESMFTADSSSRALAYLARLLRQQPTNSVVAERLMSALSYRNFCLPAAQPLRHGSPLTSSPNAKSEADTDFARYIRVGSIRAANFSPNGQRVVTASKDGTAWVWDSRTGLPVGEPLKHQAAVMWAQFNADGTRVVTASLDKTARIWNVETGQATTPPLQHDGGVLFAEFSPDSRKLITASQDKTVRLWDVETGQPLLRPITHGAAVYFARFTSDGSRLLTASADGLAWVRNSDTGEKISSFLHTMAASTAPFPQVSLDGKRLATLKLHGAVIWDVPTRKSIGAPIKHDNGVGGTLYPRYCVGFLGDFVVYWVADNNATEASYVYSVDSVGNIRKDSMGNPIIQKDSHGKNVISPRYGDYSSVRLSQPAPRANSLFSTLVYDVNTPTTGREACASGNCTTTPHYVEWGRPEDF